MEASPATSESAHAPWRRRCEYGARGIAACAIVGFCLRAGRSVNPHELWQTLMRADYRLLFVATLINLGPRVWARAARLRTLLSPLPCRAPGVQPRELWGVFLAGDAFSVLPLPFGGEAVRTMYLRRRHDYPLRALASALFVEKLVEMATFGVFSLPFLCIWDWPRPLRVPVTLVCACGLLAVVGASCGWLGRRREGIAKLLAPGVLGRSLAWGLLSAVLDLLVVELCLAAMGLAPTLRHGFAVIAAAGLAIALPVTPGQLGIFEGAVVLSLGLLGVQPEPALGSALVLHALKLLPPTLVGLICAHRLAR